MSLLGFTRFSKALASAVRAPPYRTAPSGLRNGYSPGRTGQVASAYGRIVLTFTIKATPL